jgi:pimeloyl-ACP methyl ester carboxylesterase
MPQYLNYLGLAGMIFSLAGAGAPSCSGAEASAAAGTPAAGGVASAATPSPAKPKNVFVIVHGAWGGGWAFKEVDDLLTADGNKVYRPTLTGQGEKVHLASANVDLTTHITDIVNVILWENLHDVILVGHSYGGMVITGVADAVPDRIKAIVYLDALVPLDGESVATAAGGMNLGAADATGFIPPKKGAMEQPPPHDVPMTMKALTEVIALKNQKAVAKIPTTFVEFIPPGKALETAPFYRFYQRAKANGWTMGTLNSDHNAQWSHPKEEAAILEKAAGE